MIHFHGEGNECNEAREPRHGPDLSRGRESEERGGGRLYLNHMRRDSNARGERETPGWPTMIKMKVLGVPSKPLSWSVIMLQYVSPSPTYLSLSRRCHVKLAGSVTPPAQPGQIALITPDTLTREIQVNLTYLQTCNLDLIGFGHYIGLGLGIYQMQKRMILIYQCYVGCGCFCHFCLSLMSYQSSRYEPGL